MPIVTITLMAGRPSEELEAIMSAIHQATVTALGIPHGSRNQRLVEICPEHYFYPEGKSDAYLSIEIAAFPGRSAKTKASLFQAITDNLQQLAGIKPRDVIILIHQPPLENWGISGHPAG